MALLWHAKNMGRELDSEREFLEGKKQGGEKDLMRGL